MTARRTWLAALWVGLCCLACGDDTEWRVVGTLERDRIELIAEGREPIVSIRVREGEHVKADQVLVELDDARLAAQVDGARSARDRAAARVAELERGPRSELIAEARARLAAAESSLATARIDLTRVERLVGQHVESADRLDQLRGRVDEAAARRDEARAALSRHLVGTTPEELPQALAALAAAAAALSDVTVRASRLQVRAPRPGVIDARPYELGERPPSGAVVAVMLADGAPYARVFVPASLRVHVAPGTAATVEIDGLETRYRARVRSVASDAAFTPYYALTERDRSRLAYVAEVELLDADALALPTGIPVEVVLEPSAGVASAPEAPRAN